jgi:signal transduction histidine kinase
LIAAQGRVGFSAVVLRQFPMLADLKLFGFGAAAVVETILLVAMLERRNRRSVALWMLLVSLGAWLWHAGSFANGMLRETAGPWSEPRWLIMTVMATGLLLIPSALLHGVARLHDTGLEVLPPPRPIYAVCYLPLAALIPIALQLRTGSGDDFLKRVDAFIVPYILWIGVANTISAVGFLRFRKHLAGSRISELLAWFAAAWTATALAAAFVFLFAVDRWPSAAALLTWCISLLPVLPALLFAYYVIRFQVVPLVLERTVVYGGIVVGLLLLHRFALEEVTGRLSDRLHIDFGVLEGGVALALILVYQPLRQRIAESLRYLMGSRVATLRSRMRKLAVEMSERGGQSPDELLAWFATALADALSVEYVGAWLFDADGKPSVRCGHTHALTDDHVQFVHAELTTAACRICSIPEASSAKAAEILAAASIGIALRIEHPHVRGLIVTGPLAWHRQMGEEESSLLLLLVEQLGGTIYSSQLQAEGQQAERRALQSEKLATLGLVAGSLAHEIKNPLSSIKTIATVVDEQLGPDSPHREDLRLILGEIDRLSATTTQLLDFARPSNGHHERGSIADVLDRLLRLLKLLARQKNVTLDVQIGERLPAVGANDEALREIFFNLLSNSIEATGAGGTVRVACHQENGSVIATVSDTGTGISAALLERIFDPFVTTKEAGTGLGLYTVSRRVRESGGDIRCESAPQSGTTFVVRLPCSLT